MNAEDALADLIDRLESARDGLMRLSQRPGATLPEVERLRNKRQGVLLALSYAREDRPATHHEGDDAMTPHAARLAAQRPTPAPTEESK